MDPRNSGTPPGSGSPSRYKGQGSARTRSGSRSKSRTAHGSQITTDHDEIREWVEERGGYPACVRNPGGKGDTGVLRIDFPDGEEPSPNRIPWEEFFAKFDDKGLEFMYQDETVSGQQSRFNQFISRQPADNTVGRPHPPAAPKNRKSRRQNWPRPRGVGRGV